MPVVVTSVFANGEAAPLPWISGMVRATAVQARGADALFRGAGDPVAKSAALSFVSWHPPRPRRSAVVLLGAGARPAPSKQFAVPP